MYLAQDALNNSAPSCEQIKLIFEGVQQLLQITGLTFWLGIHYEVKKTRKLISARFVHKHISRWFMSLQIFKLAFNSLIDWY